MIWHSILLLWTVLFHDLPDAIFEYKELGILNSVVSFVFWWKRGE